MRDCEICGGYGRIELPIRRRPSIQPFLPGQPLPGAATAPMAKTFSCPECGGQIGYSRLAIMREEYATASDFVDDNHFEFVKLDMAAELGRKMMAGGLIRFEDGPSISGRLTTRVRATVGVVAPGIVAEFEDRVAERQHEMAAEVVDVAKRQIKGCRAIFGDGAIRKDDAGTCVSAALLEVAADRARWRKYQNDNFKRETA